MINAWLSKKIHMPELPDSFPKRGNFISRFTGLFALFTMRWSFSGVFPEHVQKAILIVAPHTSNWDFFIGFFTMLALGLRASWFGKKSIFVFPVKCFLQFFGGIPVDRSRSSGVVDQIVDIIKKNKKLVFALSPEGTRKKVQKWKTGFYVIAKKAGIPIVPVFFDFKSKTVGIFNLFWPQGEQDSDMQKIRLLYSNINPKNPENF